MSEEFTLEKLQIHDRLSAVESKMDILIPEIQKNSEIMNKILLGNGSPETGLVFRITSMEEQKKVRDKQMQGVFASIGAILVTVVANVISKFFIHK